MTRAVERMLGLARTWCAMHVPAIISNHIRVENHNFVPITLTPGSEVEACKHLDNLRLLAQIKVLQERVHRVSGPGERRFCLKGPDEPCSANIQRALSIGPGLPRSKRKILDDYTSGRQVHEEDMEELVFSPDQRSPNVDGFLGALNGLLQSQESDDNPRLTHCRPRNHSSEDGQYYVRQVRPVHARSLA